MNCPTCKAGRLAYEYDHSGGEIECWHCDNCGAGYLVPIEIVRDFDGAEPMAAAETMGAG